MGLKIKEKSVWVNIKDKSLWIVTYLESNVVTISRLRKDDEIPYEIRRLSYTTFLNKYKTTKATKVLYSNNSNI